MNTNKPNSIFQLNNDILEIIETEINNKRQINTTIFNITSVVNHINHIYNCFIYEGHTEDFQNESAFSEWLFFDSAGPDGVGSWVDDPNN